MLLTWCHAEQNLVKGFSQCCNPSFLSQFFVWKSVNYLLILASATCLSGCFLLLPGITLSGRHLRISLLPRFAANSKVLYSFLKNSYWDNCDGWVINRKLGIELENWSATIIGLFIYSPYCLNRICCFLQCTRRFGGKNKHYFPQAALSVVNNGVIAW